MQASIMNCLSFMTVTSEQKRPDTEVVQSNGHSLSLSFGAASECGREGRLPPLSLGSPEAQRGRATLRGVLSEAGVTAPLSGGLQGFGSGRSPRLARTRKPSPANAKDTRLYICSISEKARLGAGSVLTAAVPDGGGGLGSSASSQRVNVFACNLSLNVQCLSCSGVLRPSQWIGSSFGAEGRQTAWEMGPTCAAWWMAAPLLVHVPWQPGGGRGRAGYAPPSPPLPGTLLLGVWGGGGEENHPRPLSPPPRHGGQGAHGCLGGGRTEPSCFGRGRFRPLGEICCAVQPPLPADPPLPDAHRRPLSHDPAFALLIWRDQVGCGITNVIGCYK
eukprot:XP_027313078.1 uncharacterized protein LOC110352779 isoform X1 [Anas platyrhynchos]